MTPTTRDAIAQAIAALEDGLRLHEFIKGADVDGEHPRQLVKNIRAALASLRSLAPAPADDEVGVEEFLFDSSSFPKEIYVRSVMSRHLMTEFRCVAAKPIVEPEVKYLRADLAPAPADQSDAGPVERVAEVLKNRLPFIIAGEDMGDLARVVVALSKSESDAGRNAVIEAGWQSIDTAPLDGTNIDLWCSPTGISTGPGRTPDCWYAYGEWRTYDEAEGYRKISNATYWMPIPKDPK